MADAVRARVARVPDWAWLAAIVVCSAAFRVWLVRGMPAPFVFVDELIYSELARSLAHTGTFAVRGVATNGYSILYPALLAPAYGLVDGLPRAYAAAKATNAVAMSLAAVPAWLITRRVAGRWLSLLAAVIAVAVPSMAYTATVVTENLFYPVALLFAWTLVLVLERPSAGRILALVAALAASVATRSQAIGFVGAVLLAPFLLALLRRDRSVLRRFAPLLGGIVVLGVLARRGAAGARAVALRPARCVQRRRGGRLRRRPGAALLALARRGADPLRGGRPRRCARRPPLAREAAARGRAGAPRRDDRDAGDVDARRRRVRVPLRVRPRPGPLPVLPRAAPRRRARRVGGARGAAAARAARRRLGRSRSRLVVAFPYTRFIGEPAKSDSFGLLPLWSANAHLVGGSYRLTVLVAALVLVALFALVPARVAYVVPLVLLASSSSSRDPCGRARTACSARAKARSSRASEASRAAGSTAASRAQDDVAVLWTGRADRFTVNQNEFFNRAVGDVYYTSAPTPGGIGETPVRVAADGIVRTPDGGTVDRPYALARRFRDAGRGGRRARRPRHHAVAAEGAARVADPGDRPLSERHLVGPHGDLDAPPVHGRPPARRPPLRPHPLRRAAHARPGESARRAGGTDRRSARGNGHAPRSPRARRQALPCALHRHADPRAGRGDPGEHRRPRARARTSTPSSTWSRSEDRGRRDATLASPHGDRQLHPWLARGHGRRRGRAPRARRVRTDERARPGGDPGCSGGHPRVGAVDPAPGLARASHRLEQGRAPDRRAARGTCSMRSSSANGCIPPSGAACGRRSSTTSSRCTTPSGALRGRSRCTPTRRATRPRPATSCSRTRCSRRPI